MNIWKILNIEPTTDKKAIKKAYKELLKTTRPDDNQSAFIELRNAYEKAIEYANNEDVYEEEYEEFDEKEYDEEEYDETIEEYDYCDEELSQETIAKLQRKREFNERLNAWTDEVFTAIHDFSKVGDAVFWRKFLSESIAYELRFFNACKKRMYNMCLEGSEVFLSEEVLKVIDEFFDFSVSAVVMAHSTNDVIIRRNNKRLQLNEMIDFAAFGKVENNDFQNFCRTYKLLIEKLPFYEEDDEPAKYYSNVLGELDVQYLPFECLNLALYFDEYPDNEITFRIEELSDKYGDSDYIRLLWAEYYIYSKAFDKAEIILKALYKKMPLKNYPFIYQAAVCCKKVSMYLESYMLIKQLTWLNPQAFMYDMAQELFETAHSEYENKLKNGENISDYEHIAMSRLCIRTYSKRKKSNLILDRVGDTRSWEYNVADILYLFNEFELEKAEACFEILDNYPKEELSPLDALEYRELKARWLLQHKKLEECIDKCNELLEEYPLSYTMLMLRSYADNEISHIKGHGMDLGWLSKCMPQRPEGALILASTNSTDNYYKDACRLLEPYKDICYVEYMFNKIRVLNHKNYDEYIDSMMSLCDFINNNEVDATDYSRFGFVTLKNVYTEMASAAAMLNDIDSVKGRKFYNMLENMQNSKFNKPEKYVDLNYLYYCFKKLNKLYENLKNIDIEAIDNSSEYTEVIRQLLCVYSSENQIENIESLADKIDFNRLKNRTHKRAIYRELAGVFQDNNIFDKAEEYALKALEINNGKMSYYSEVISVYLEWGKRSELSKNEKCIEIIDSALSTCGRIGDLNNLDNVYKFKALCLARLGRYDEAELAMADCFKYTKKEIIKKNYYSDYSLLYEYMGDYDKAYEYIMKCEEQNPDTDRFFANKVSIKLKAEKYFDAAEIFINSVEEYDKSFLMYAVHCFFLENMTHNMEFVKEIYNTLPELIDKYEEARIGYNYITMAEASYIMGDMESYTYYNELSKQFEWDNEREKYLNETRFKLWKMMYEKEYQKAYDIINDDKFYIIEDDVEFGALQRKLNKISKEGIM